MAVTPGRVLIVTAAAGSLSRLVVPQVAGLNEAGWDVHLAAGPDTAGDLTSINVPFHTVNALERKPNPVQDVAALWEMHQVIRRLRPEVVMGGTPKGALVAMTAGRVARTPIRIYHARGARWEGSRGTTRRLLIGFEKATVSSSTGVLAVSPSLADLMTAEGICRQRPTVLGAGGSKGVDLERFGPRASYPRTVTAPSIGMVGRLTGDKGLTTGIDVFDGIRARHPNAQLTLIGHEDHNSPVPAQVWKRLEDPQIHLLGRIDPAEVARRMPQFDLLLFPSVREGLPNAVIEAAASGVPAVGWNVTGVRDAIATGRNGFLLPFNEVDDMINAALSLISQDRGELASKAREWSKNFDSKRLDRLLDEYLRSNVDHAVGVSGYGRRGP